MVGEGKKARKKAMLMGHMKDKHHEPARTDLVESSHAMCVSHFCLDLACSALETDLVGRVQRHC